MNKIKLPSSTLRETDIQLSRIENILYFLMCIFSFGSIFITRIFSTRVEAKILGKKGNTIYLALCILSFGGYYLVKIYQKVSLIKAQELVAEEDAG